jgi:glycerophosphoryl diester phosphodiesterase
MLRRLGHFATAALLSIAAITASGTAALGSSASLATAPVTDIGHRGASAYAPENTIASFELAADQRADMFEFDVQETSDHQLVIMHDTTLARTTDAEEVFPDRVPWRVGDFTLAEIRRLDAGSWFGPRFAGERVPTLDEALHVMQRSGLGALLEIKAPDRYPGIEQRVADELCRNPYWLVGGGPRPRLVVQSFDWGSMHTFHALLPSVPIGLLGTPTADQLPELASFADEINPPYQDISTGFVSRVHGLGMKVAAWPVDDPAIMRRMIDDGVDGIITDKPDVLAGVLSTEPHQAT